jgi:hypothetical protein
LLQRLIEFLRLQSFRDHVGKLFRTTFPNSDMINIDEFVNALKGRTAESGEMEFEKAEVETLLSKLENAKEDLMYSEGMIFRI